MKLLKLSALLAFTLLFIRCDKDKADDGQNGTNTTTANHFSCYVDGVYWEAKTPSSLMGPVSLQGEYFVNSGYLNLKATLKNSDKEIFESYFLAVDSIFSIGNYPPSVINDNTTAFIDLYERNCYKYYYNPKNKGSVQINTINKEKRIISGTFSFELINKSCSPDSIRKIDNGSFILNY